MRSVQERHFYIAYCILKVAGLWRLSIRLFVYKEELDPLSPIKLPSAETHPKPENDDVET
jgi:hypothetical protein